MKKKIILCVLFYCSLLFTSCTLSPKEVPNQTVESAVQSSSLSPNEFSKDVFPIYQEYLRALVTNHPFSITRSVSESLKLGAFTSKLEGYSISKFILYDKNNLYLSKDNKRRTAKDIDQEVQSLEKQNGKLYFLAEPNNDYPLPTILQAESEVYHGIESILQNDILIKLINVDTIKNDVKKVTFKKNSVYTYQIVDKDQEIEDVTILLSSNKIIVKHQLPYITVVTKVALLPADTPPPSATPVGSELTITGTKDELPSVIGHDNIFNGKAFNIDTHGFYNFSVMVIEKKYILLEIYSEVYPDLGITLEIGAVPDKDRLISFDSQNDWKKLPNIQTDSFAGTSYQDVQNSSYVFESETGDIPVKARLFSRHQLNNIDQEIFKKVLNSISIY